MIAGMKGLWILNEAKEVLFSFELLTHETQDFNTDIFSNILSGKSYLILQIDEAEFKKLELAGEKIFVSIDMDTRLIFIIGAKLSASDAVMNSYLMKIQNRFVPKFWEGLNLSLNQQKLYFNTFSHDLTEILEDTIEQRISKMFS